MLLHLTPLVERQRPRFFEKPGRQTDLADVVNETTEMSELLFLLGQAQTACNVACIDRDGGRVTRRVSIPSVECRDKGGCEGDVGSFESHVRFCEPLS